VIVLDAALIVATQIVLAFYFYVMFKSANKVEKPQPVLARQSTSVINFNNRIDKILEEPKLPKTQSTDYVSKHSVKAIVVDDSMYWIANNAFYVADIVDGNVEENTTRLVDTMTMDKVQLDKMMFIVDKLREGD
jgi:hypothetical protein